MSTKTVQRYILNAVKRIIKFNYCVLATFVFYSHGSWLEVEIKIK